MEELSGTKRSGKSDVLTVSRSQEGGHRYLKTKTFYLDLEDGKSSVEVCPDDRTSLSELPH